MRLCFYMSCELFESAIKRERTAKPTGNRSRFSNISYQDAIGYKLANPCLLFWSVTTCHDAQQLLSAHCKDVELIRSSLLHTGLVEHAKTSTAQ